MSKHLPLLLTDDQRTHLLSLIHAGTAPARVQTRARILLLSDGTKEPRPNDAQMARTLLSSPATLWRVRHRFHQQGLEAALYEKPRPGRPPKITGDIEAKLCVLACSNPPDGQARWTLRLLARQIVAEGHLPTISHVAVGDRLKKTL